MADPYLASNEFPGDGVQTLFNISFKGNRPDAGSGVVPYLNPADVKAQLITPATATEAEIVVDVPAVYVGPNQFQVTPAAPVGKIVRLYRATEDEYALVDYQSLQTVGEADLDLSNRQLVFITQEAHDLAVRASEDASNSSEVAYNAIAVANAATDTAEDALSVANTAIATANSALGVATNAETKSDQALAAAASAEAHATDADVAAAAAQTAADAAQAQATAANIASTNAVAVANGVDAKATTALANSITANDNANTALTTANGVDAKATTALANANTALTNANTALTTANGVDAKATTALDNSVTASNTANSALSAASVADGKAVAAQTTANTANSAAGVADGKAVAAQTTANTAQTSANTANTKIDNHLLLPRSFINLLINARGQINHRNYVSGTATTGARQYTLDRWLVQTSGQNLTFSTSGIDRTLTAPAGGLEQVVEGVNNMGGVFTLSWTGSATATVNGTAITNGGQTASLTAGTDIAVRFSGGTVLKPQLEHGSVVSQFEESDYQRELQRCQRYCCRFYAASGGLYNQGGAQAYAGYQFPQEMRVTPTVTLGLSTGSVNVSSVSIANTLTIRGGFCISFSAAAGGFVGTSIDSLAVAEIA